MTKELLRLDKYYYLEESPLLRHKDYPPFATLLQYLWCRLCGTYKEQHLYNAEMVFSLSLILSLFSFLQILIEQRNSSTRKKSTYITSVLLMPFFIIILSLCCIIGEASFYQSIYTESVLTCLFLYGLFVFIFKERNSTFDCIHNVIFLSSLLLVKQIAIYFFAILFLIYLIKQILTNGYAFFVNKKQLLYTICMLLIPFNLLLLWKKAVSLHAPAGQFDLHQFSLKNIIAFATMKGDEYQYLTSQKYFIALFTRPIIKKPFPIPYIPFVIIIFLLIIAIAHLEKDIITKKHIHFFAICEALTCTLYIGVMFISYLYGFHPSESLNLACYDRYMNTVLYPFILGSIVILLYVLCRNTALNINMLLASILVSCIIILIPSSTLKYELLPGIFCEDITGIYQSDWQNIINTTPEDAKILIIRQNGNTGTWSYINIIAYKTLPRIFDDNFFSFGDPYYEGDVYTWDYGIEEFAKLLKQFDYLYISQIDEQFIERYQSLFGDTKLENNMTIKINP